jgi:TolA-binding protein
MKIITEQKSGQIKKMQNKFEELTKNFNSLKLNIQKTNERIEKSFDIKEFEKKEKVNIDENILKSTLLEYEEAMNLIIIKSHEKMVKISK